MTDADTSTEAQRGPYWNVPATVHEVAGRQRCAWISHPSPEGAKHANAQLCARRLRARGWTVIGWPGDASFTFSDTLSEDRTMKHTGTEPTPPPSTASLEASLRRSIARSETAAALQAVGCLEVELFAPTLEQHLRADETGHVAVLDEDGAIRVGVSVTQLARELRAVYERRSKGRYFR